MSTGGEAGCANQTCAGCVASQQIALSRGPVFKKNGVTFTNNVSMYGTVTNTQPCVSSNPKDLNDHKGRPLPPAKAGPLLYDPMVMNAFWRRLLFDSMFKVPASDATEYALAASTARRTGVVILTGTIVCEEIDEYVNSAATGEWEEIDDAGSGVLRARDFMWQLPLDAETLASVGAGAADFGPPSYVPRILIHRLETQQPEVRRWRIVACRGEERQVLCCVWYAVGGVDGH